MGDPRCRRSRSKLASKVKSILTEGKRHSHQRTGLAKQLAVVLDRCLQKK
jgi:hypothetical protein